MSHCTCTNPRLRVRHDQINNNSNTTLRLNAIRSTLHNYRKVDYNIITIKVITSHWRHILLQHVKAEYMQYLYRDITWSISYVHTSASQHAKHNRSITILYYLYNCTNMSLSKNFVLLLHLLSDNSLFLTTVNM